MKGSLQRVRDVVQGRAPDRPPLYDLLRNDTVLSHFAGETLTLENARAVVYRAYEPAVDATRPLVRLPQAEGVTRLEDGREQRLFRWTTWTGHVHYADPDAWAAAKRALLRQHDPAWNGDKQARVDAFIASSRQDAGRLGEVFYFPAMPSPSFTWLYAEVGLEMFAYCFADHPDLMHELLERSTQDAVNFVDHLPADHGIEAAFVGDDIAFKTQPLMSPAWFDRHYLPRLARVCAAYHRQGIAVLFHSDGDLNAILSGLVDAGIDGLNPLEVLANMDAGDIHRRFPRLFLAGGIDVSHLLPFGSPAQVRDAVRRAIDQTQGRLMVGSSTELNNAVPLANYLALRDAVLEG